LATEKHVFGPPGSGKTTYICNNIIKDMADQYGEGRLMITSFTKTAAINIAERAGLTNSEKHGTLHSISYNALGRPPLVDSAIKDWNSTHSEYRISHSKEGINGEEPHTSKLLSDYNVFRNLMIPKDSWYNELKLFVEKWEDFKQQTHTIDYTDMIIQGKEQFPAPPFGISAIIVDEAQDFTPLQISLVRSWGVTIPMVWFVYDDDQAIFSFQGANVSALMYPEFPIEDKNKIYLQQSYRVPAMPHQFAEEISRKISVREEKIYKPTKKIGNVAFGDGSLEQHNWLFENLEKTKDETSMIMASCAYMLGTLIVNMKEKGIPFHNPYKTEEKRWNPLSNNVSNIVYNFLSSGEDDPYWSTEQLLVWLPEIKVYNKKKSVLGKKRGINKMIEILRKELKNGTEGLHTCREYLHDLLPDEVIDLALNRDLDWFYETILGKYKSTLQYALNIASKKGKDALREVPRIMIGTIHSFKGTEADNVYVFPDLSYAAMKEWDKNVLGKDSIHRLMYVAVTRTQKNLYIMKPGANSKGLYYTFPNIKDVQKNFS